MTLIDLPGTDKKETECGFIHKLNDLSKLSKEFALTDAGEHGAINIWIDKDGVYRVEAMRNLRKIESKEFTNKNYVKSWVARWRKIIHNL